MRILILILFCNSVFALSTKDKIFNTLVSNGVDTLSAKIFVAQAHHESGGFKSTLTREHNNIFAILHDKHRTTTSIGPYGKAEGRSGYASYLSIEDATIDFIIFLKHWGVSIKQTSITKYSYALKNLKSPKGHKRMYYTDNVKNYIKSVYTRYKKLWLQ